FQSFVAEEPLQTSRDIPTPVTGCSEAAELSTPLVTVCEDKVTCNNLYQDATTSVHYKKLANRRTKKCLTFKQRLKAAERYAIASNFGKTLYETVCTEISNDAITRNKKLSKWKTLRRRREDVVPDTIKK
ncbi:hypothetical protein CBL_12842, partial [Carabus blaptoides fortunei]